MATIFDPHVRDALLARVDRLTPDLAPRWGRMTAPQMLVHVTAACRQAAGEMDAGVEPGPISRFPLNWLLIHVLPWPKGRAKSPQPFIDARPPAWDSDLAELKSRIRELSARGPGAAWPASPAFGRISGDSWGVLQYRHLDHHLSQFGV